MLEGAAVDMFKNFNNTLMGSVLVLTLIAFVFAVRFLQSIIRDLQQQLAKEREDHQKTRDAQIADLRNLGHVATSVESVTRSVDRLQTTVVDALGRRGSA